MIFEDIKSEIQDFNNDENVDNDKEKDNSQLKYSIKSNFISNVLKKKHREKLNYKDLLDRNKYNWEKLIESNNNDDIKIKETIYKLLLTFFLPSICTITKNTRILALRGLEIIGDILGTKPSIYLNINWIESKIININKFNSNNNNNNNGNHDDNNNFYIQNTEYDGINNIIYDKINHNINNGINLDINDKINYDRKINEKNQGKNILLYPLLKYISYDQLTDINPIKHLSIIDIWKFCLSLETDIDFPAINIKRY